MNEIHTQFHPSDAAEKRNDNKKNENMAKTYYKTRGVDKFFKTLASKEFFTRQVRQQLAPSTETVSEREKILARLASGSVFLLAKPEFYSHLASW
jgi:hypothetical protein